METLASDGGSWRATALWGPDSPTCAGCGATENTKPDPRCGNISFCDDCQQRARTLSAWDDLGVGD